MRRTTENYLNFLKENNEKSRQRETLEKLMKNMDEHFVMTKSVWQLFATFNASQPTPQNFVTVPRDSIFMYTSLFYKQDRYNAEYLGFLMDLVSIYHKEENPYYNDVINRIKGMNLTLSLNYNQNIEPYFCDSDLQKNFEELLAHSLNNILEQMNYVDFGVRFYPSLKKYNPILAHFLTENWDYLYDFLIRRQKEMEKNAFYDISIDIELQCLLMVWVTMLDEYPTIKGREWILTLSMNDVRSNLPYVCHLLDTQDINALEELITGIVENYKQNAHKIYTLH